MSHQSLGHPGSDRQSGETINSLTLNVDIVPECAREMTLILRAADLAARDNGQIRHGVQRLALPIPNKRFWESTEIAGKRGTN
jgi:hypothetical protein